MVWSVTCNDGMARVITPALLFLFSWPSDARVHMWLMCNCQVSFQSVLLHWVKWDLYMSCVCCVCVKIEARGTDRISCIACLALNFSLLFMALQSNCGPELMNLPHDCLWCVSAECPAAPFSSVTILCLSFHFLSRVLCYRNDIVLHRDKLSRETRAVFFTTWGGRALLLGSFYNPCSWWWVRRNFPEQSPASASRVIWEELKFEFCRNEGEGKIHIARCDRRRNDRVMFKLLSSRQTRNI